MSKFFEETILKNEYEHILKFQDFGNISTYIRVFYFNRITGQKQAIHTPPQNGYPYKFEVIYTIPVYESKGRLRNDFTATAIITVTEEQLTKRLNGFAPSVEFSANLIPFNNHVKDTWICIGNAWHVAKDNGIWHFIMCLGALINQDIFVTDDENPNHINPSAFQYWAERGKKPINNIKWPLNLLTLIDEAKGIKVGKAPDKPLINIIPKAKPSNESIVKPLNIVKKDSATSSIPKITISRKE